MRKISLLFFALMLVLSSAMSVSAENKDKAKDNKKVTYIELTQEEAQQFEIINGGVLDENIVGGTIVLDSKMSDKEKKAYKKNLLKPRHEPQKPKGDVSALWCTGYYVTNVAFQGDNWYFPAQRLGFSEGFGPITLSVTINQGVSATWSANVGVSAEVVSAGVGYSVTSSYSVASSGSWNVPSGTHGRLEAYALHDKHTWDVYDDDCGDPADTYVGYGSSYKPNGGVYFKKVVL